MYLPWADPAHVSAFLSVTFLRDAPSAHCLASALCPQTAECCRTPRSAHTHTCVPPCLQAPGSTFSHAHFICPQQLFHSHPPSRHPSFSADTFVRQFTEEEGPSEVIFSWALHSVFGIRPGILTALWEKVSSSIFIGCCLYFSCLYFSIFPLCFLSLSSYICPMFPKHFTYFTYF